MLQNLLIATSLNLYNVTEARVQLRHVHIKLPATWAACAPPTTRHTSQWTATDLRLSEARHPLLADAPWTVQFGGCGTPGRNIEVPLAFANQNASSLAERAERLSKEWVKYRFGVFEEAGFKGDSLYPETFQEGNMDLANSGCNYTVKVRIRKYVINENVL